MKEHTIDNPSNENMLKVEKVWGEEHWIVNKEYCGKLLKVRKGHRSSFHGHKIKDETFYIVGGKILFLIGDDKGNVKSSRIMTKGDIQYIAPLVWHRFIGLEDSDMMEFSTTHREDDSYRVPTMLSGRIPEDEFTKLKTQHEQ